MKQTVKCRHQLSQHLQLGTNIYDFSYLDPEVPWRNPFGVSDKIIVQKLGGSVAFRYASVLVEGPR